MRTILSDVALAIEPTVNEQRLHRRRRPTITLTPLPPDAHEVDLTVFALIPKYRLAVTRDVEDHQYSVTRKTPRIKVDELRLGMRLRCVVTTRWRGS